jgi:hypothetical protein
LISACFKTDLEKNKRKQNHGIFGFERVSKSIHQRHFYYKGTKEQRASKD